MSASAHQLIYSRHVPACVSGAVLAFHQVCLRSYFIDRVFSWTINWTAQMHKCTINKKAQRRLSAEEPLVFWFAGRTSQDPSSGLWWHQPSFMEWSMVQYKKCVQSVAFLIYDTFAVLFRIYYICFNLILSTYALACSFAPSTVAVILQMSSLWD